MEKIQLPAAFPEYTPLNSRLALMDDNCQIICEYVVQAQAAIQNGTDVYNYSVWIYDPQDLDQIIAEVFASSLERESIEKVVKEAYDKHHEQHRS